MAEIRNCEHCSAAFKAKASQVKVPGHGRFCSRACASAGGAWRHLTTSENMALAADSRRQSVAVNGTKHKSGPEHHSWTGGPEERRKRKVAKDVIYTREYRKRNPEMMREARAKRRGVGRLPRGTVKRIGEAQRWKCAVCRIDIAGKYHMDHILPLAKGGGHEPNNIQLLCPSCNVRKNAKHPVDFMQERGFLL